MSLMSIISPAKSLNFESTAPPSLNTPRFPKETLALVSKLKKLKPKALSELMSISTPLAELNATRYQQFSEIYDANNSKAAIYAFTGDVYLGIQANDLDQANIDYLQSNLRILSGLYGLLKPMDALQAYRLEMGTSLPIKQSKNLYQYWGNKITKMLNEDLKDNQSDTLLNLASIEYFKSVDTKKLEAEVVNVHFKEYRGEQLKVISFNAKKARGMMVRYLAQNNIHSLEAVKNFNLDQYEYNESLSNPTDFYFTR